MGRGNHFISNVDMATRMGDCAVCGRVKVYTNGRNRPVQYHSCSKRVAETVYKTRKAEYGWTAEQRDQYLIGKTCQICSESSIMHIDHDHETGVVRGALCQKCNMALGLMRDNPLLLRLAADYLERPSD